MSNHYLIHLPHCGTEIPSEYIDDYYLDENELRANIFEYADLYTDELFFKLFESCGGVKSRYSRLFFDPERFGNDDEESMYLKYKLGWFYENAILEKKSLRSLKNKNIIRSYYDKHHAMLNQLTAKKLESFGKCSVIDAHSFSNTRYWFHDDIKLPDICVGFEPKHVDEELLERIKIEFEGYEIGINEPYQGSLVPTNYWQKDTRVKSVMIEINKKLYLEDDNITKNSNFEIIKRKLENILKI